MSEGKKQEEVTISIVDLFKYIWKNKILVLIITLVITILGASYAFFIAKPKYVSSTSFVVALNQTSNSTSEANDYDQVNSLRLVPTVVSLVKEGIVMGPVAEEYSMSAGQLRKMVSVANEDNSLLISVSVSNADPEKTRDIANSIVTQLIKITDQNENLALLKGTITQTTRAEKGVYASPNKLLYTIIAFIGGLVVSFIVVFFKEFASNKFKKREEIESMLDSRVIGFFVDDETKKVKKTGKNKGRNHQSFELLPVNTRNLEPYNGLFTNIKYSDLEKSNKVIMITSSQEGELKSTIISNLATCIKNNNQSVVVVDLDMRKPVIHKFFKLSRENGIVEYIEGACSLEEVIKHSESGVDVITTGKKILNPVVIIEHSGLAKLIEELKERYDYVLIDTPPVMVCSDSILISKLCDGVIFNVTMNEVKKKDAKNALESIKLVGTRVIGVNVTKGVVEESGANYYYSKKYGYNSYKYEETKEDQKVD